MPTPTYTPLANITLGSSAASVTFSSIAAGLYRDLVLVCQVKTVANNTLIMRLNGDTSTSNYPRLVMLGNGSSTSSYATTNDGFIVITDGAGTSSTTDSIIQLNFMDYAATDKHKTILSRFNRADAETVAMASRWASTSAITSIVVSTYSSSIAAGSTFALYGIAA